MRGISIYLRSIRIALWEALIQAEAQTVFLSGDKGKGYLREGEGDSSSHGRQAFLLVQMSGHSHANANSKQRFTFSAQWSQYLLPCAVCKQSLGHNVTLGLVQRALFQPSKDLRHKTCKAARLGRQPQLLLKVAPFIIYIHIQNTETYQRNSFSVFLLLHVAHKVKLSYLHLTPQ